MNMELPTYLLLVLGCLGAADILLYHSIAHGIRSHPGSAMELVTHSLRGPTYAALFLLIPNFRLEGLMLGAMLALFVVDVGISIWDFSLERQSRQLLGGLPGGEYVLHMLIAMVFGALAMSIVMSRPVLPVVPQSRSEAAHSRVLEVPRPEVWMRQVLTAAGIYNLLWGAWVSAWPNALFRWAGMAPINYPQIWQCVGMIVGVYSVGYLIAARDPFRHWPIVLVGLIGKVLGPVGMLVSILKGDFPVTMAWTCLTNDLLWWVPFGMILYKAGDWHRSRNFQRAV
jgi:small multidrug resistance pump